MKWFQIELTDEEHKGLRVYAATTGRTMVECVRGLIASATKAAAVIEQKVVNRPEPVVKQGKAVVPVAVTAKDPCAKCGKELHGKLRFVGSEKWCLECSDKNK